jgi:hypothetical protein
MEIDKGKLAALANLDDAAFGNIIYSVIIASGGSQSAARSAMTSAPIIKAKLKNASDKELRQIIGFIGEKNAADILGKMGK